MNTPLPVVDVSGTPEKMGKDYGAQAADLIRANVEAYLARFERAVGLDRAAVIASGAAFGRTTRQHFPRLATMLESMGAAAGVAPELIYAINARSELLYGAPTCGSPIPSQAGPAVVPAAIPAAVKAAVSAGDGECTAIGVLGDHTLLAQNWDWHPDQRPYTLLLITHDEKGHSVAALTEAGMLAKSGLNSAGVGVCVNLIGSDRDGRPGGVPYHVLLRSVLEADSLSWATRNAFRSPRSASINLLIGQPGEIIDLELVPGDGGWMHPEDGILVHANHFETRVPVYDTIKDWGGSSLFRSARARRLLSATERKMDDILEVLKDHHSAPLAICRHVDPRDADADRSETIWTVLMDLDELTLRLIPGPPCEGGPGKEFSLR